MYHLNLSLFCLHPNPISQIFKLTNKTITQNSCFYPIKPKPPRIITTPSPLEALALPVFYTFHFWWWAALPLPSNTSPSTRQACDQVTTNVLRTVTLCWLKTQGTTQYIYIRALLSKTSWLQVELCLQKKQIFIPHLDTIWVI